MSQSLREYLTTTFTFEEKVLETLVPLVVVMCILFCLSVVFGRPLRSTPTGDQHLKPRPEHAIALIAGLVATLIMLRPLMV